MPKSALFAAALIAAPALAQTAPPAQSAPQPTMPPPEFMAAAQTFGQCIGTKSLAVPKMATPEAAAHTAVAACATERSALDARFETWVSGPTFPVQGRDMAHQQYKAQMTGLEAQVAAKIRESRANATAPAPAPSPAPTPAPRR